MRAIGLHAAALRGALGILDQQAALGALDKADEQDQAHDHHEETADHHRADRTRTAAFEQVRRKAGELGDNTRHDDQRHAVTDAAAGDLFAQPQQEHGAADEVDDRDHAEHDARIDHRLQAGGIAIGLKPGGEKPALHRAQEHRAVARILVQFLAARLAFLLQRDQRGMQRSGQLDHDRGGDVGHHAERDQAHAFERTAREGVEQVEDTAARLVVKRLQDQRIDAGQRHEAEETEHDQRADREPDPLAQLGRLAEVGKAQRASEIVGA